VRANKHNRTITRDWQRALLQFRDRETHLVVSMCCRSRTRIPYGTSSAPQSSDHYGCVMSYVMARARRRIANPKIRRPRRCRARNRLCDRARSGLPQTLFAVEKTKLGARAIPEMTMRARVVVGSKSNRKLNTTLIPATSSATTIATLGGELRANSHSNLDCDVLTFQCKARR
jgi:hypothetical protein